MSHKQSASNQQNIKPYTNNDGTWTIEHGWTPWNTTSTQENAHLSFWTANRDVAKWTRLPVFLVKNGLLAGLPRVFNSSKLGLPVSSQRHSITLLWPLRYDHGWEPLACIPSLAGEKLVMVVDQDFIFVAQIPIVVVASTYIPAA